MITLQRLNLDNSYHIQLGELRLLIDPWLEGPEIDFFPWFNKQWHRTKPIGFADVPEFDAVLITQKYPDHFHEVTLAKLQPKVVIGPRSIEKQLEKLLPNSRLLMMDKSADSLEISGVKIRFYPTSRKIDPIYDAFELDDGMERIFLATHGFSPTKLQEDKLKSSTSCGLLITPFNRYVLPFFLGGVVAPGINNVEQLCEILSPRNVVATHDEDKHAEGIVSKFAQITWAPTAENLQRLNWLKDRYLHINHYNQIELT